MRAEILSNLIITKVMSLSTMIYNTAGAKGHRTDRKYWALAIKYEGETEYVSSDHRIKSDATSVVLLPKGSSYDWKCTRTGHCAILEFECETTYDRPLGFFVKNGDKILKLMKDLEHKRAEKTPLTMLESISDAYKIILTLAKSEYERYTPTTMQAKINSAIKYISENYTKKISNNELAEMCGLSTVYFRKLFTAITGYSPILYARMIRIEKAKEMLESDHGSLTDVALCLGYTSLYDFSRDFKKHAGIAPSNYK